MLGGQHGSFGRAAAAEAAAEVAAKAATEAAAEAAVVAVAGEGAAAVAAAAATASRGRTETRWGELPSAGPGATAPGLYSPSSQGKAQLRPAPGFLPSAGPTVLHDGTRWAVHSSERAPGRGRARRRPELRAFVPRRHMRPRLAPESPAPRASANGDESGVAAALGETGGRGLGGRGAWDSWVDRAESPTASTK